MTSFSHFGRPRHVFSIGERPVWQLFLEQCVRDLGWLVSDHTFENVRCGRVDIQEIERLKNLDNWYVWALELGTEDVKLKNPKPKLLVRYPSPDFDKWQLGGAVALDEQVVIVTIFPKYPWLSS